MPVSLNCFLFHLWQLKHSKIKKKKKKAKKVQEQQRNGVFFEEQWGGVEMAGVQN